jgi:Mu-like prophage FluMu N-terminal domain
LDENTMAKEPDKKLIKVSVAALQAEGRWRAGLHFTQEPREVEVTEEQLQELKDDPIIAIVVPEKPTDTKTAEPKA